MSEITGSQLCFLGTSESEQEEKWFNFLKIGVIGKFSISVFPQGTFVFPVNGSFYRKYLLSLTLIIFFLAFPALMSG